MSRADYYVRFRFSVSTVVDVSADVMAIGISRALANDRRSLGAGTADIVLDNSDGRYSPEVSSWHLGFMRPNMEVEIDAVNASSGGLFVLGSTALGSGTLLNPDRMFLGFVDEIGMSPDFPREIRVSCRDRVKDLIERSVDTEVMTSVAVSSMMQAVFDAASLQTSVVSIDTISDQIPFAWFRDRKLSTVLAEVIEAGGYAAYVAKDGTIRFRDKFFDIGGTVVGSFQEFYDLRYSLSDSEVINEVRVRGIPRHVVNSLQVVAELQDVIAIPASGAVGFWLEYRDPRNLEAAPAIDVQTPVATTDFMTNTASDGSGSDTTGTTSVSVGLFAETAVNTVFNGTGSTVYLTRYQVRGEPIVRDPFIAVEYLDTDSQDSYGVQKRTIESRLIGTVSQAETRARDYVSIMAKPAPKITLGIRNQYPEIITLDLGDVVHVVDSFTGIDGQFSIQEISHQISASDGGWVHSAAFGIERTREYQILVLASYTRGILGKNRLGVTSADMSGKVPIAYTDSETDRVEMR